MKQLESIQVLRAYAALVVTFGHCLSEAHSIAVQRGGTFELGFFSWGFGVDVFFVISGFIMTYAGTRNYGSVRAAQDFFIRRLIRIVPLYWLVTLAVAGGALLAPSLLNGAPPSTGSVMMSLLFIPYQGTDGGIVPVVPLGWSLNYEMFFYVAFALCMLLPRRRGMTTLVLFMGACALAGVIFRPETAQLKTWTDSLALEFLFGVGIASALMAGAKIRGAALLVLGAGALGAACLAMFNIFPAGPRVIIGGLPALLLVGFAVAAPQLKPSRGVSWLITMGDASYSLYLVHFFVVRIAGKVWVALGLSDLSPWVFSIVALVGSISAGLLCYFLVERPITRFLKTRYKSFQFKHQPAIEPA